MSNTLARARISGSLSCILPAVSTSTTSMRDSLAKCIASQAIPAASFPATIFIRYSFEKENKNTAYHIYSECR